MKMKQAAARCDEIELKKNAKEANQIERREAECKEGAKTQRVWEENCQEGKVYFRKRQKAELITENGNAEKREIELQTHSYFLSKTHTTQAHNCMECWLRVDWQMQLKYNIYLGCFEFCKT